MALFEEFSNGLVNLFDVKKDEQGDEIRENLAEYYANPEQYSMADLEEIFQDRDPFEFL
jgi:hypothetical protein